MLSIGMMYGVTSIMNLVQEGTASSATLIASSRALDGDELLRIGELHEIQRHWQEALPYYQRALAAFREKRIHGGEAQALLKIAQVLEQQGKLDEALASVNESLRVLSGTRDWKMQARTLLRRGQIAEALGRWTDAVMSYEQAGTLFERTHDMQGRQGRIEALVKQGAVEIRQDELRKGLDLLQRAYQDARQQSFSAQQMAALLEIGEAQRRLEDLEAARKSFEEGSTLAHDLQEMRQEALFSVRLARLHQSAGHYAPSRSLAQHALVLYQSVRDRLGEADALSLLGTLYLNEDNLEQATAHHQRALELYRALRDRSREAGSLINLGIVDDAQGSSQPAHDLYNKALFLLLTAP
jgi:tetratricopeptide (TPR) repeat protein